MWVSRWSPYDEGAVLATERFDHFRDDCQGPESLHKKSRAKLRLGAARGVGTDHCQCIGAVVGGTDRAGQS